MKLRLTILFLFVAISNLFACRYTVREIGFADFGKDQYWFVLFNDGSISDGDIKTFKNTARAAMLDANVIVEVIDVNNDESSLTKYYKEYAGKRKPNIMLISPEQRAKEFFIDESENFSLALWDLIEEILISPARNELTKNIIKAYGVIFFVEGNNKEENEKARALLNIGIDEIKKIMGGLPHPVHTPPHVITIKSNETEKESVLLWSLGWEKKDAEHPAIAMMYGRARRMGPILTGNMIKQDVIENMMRFIGEDCECGLDRSWMLGTMLPLRWDSKLKAAVFKEHGFDADNPLIISEMSQILSIAPERVNNSIDTDILYGYSESVLIITESAKEEKLQVKKTIKKADTSKNVQVKKIESKKTEAIKSDSLETIPVASEKKKTEPPIVEKKSEVKEESYNYRDSMNIVLIGFFVILVIGFIIFIRKKY